jgi:uncharacterized membrane protein
MPAAATKSCLRLERVEVSIVSGKELPMTRVERPVRQEEARGLYVTTGAMFAGLLGVFLFAAPGGVLGAAAGALAGLFYAQHRRGA